MKEPQEQAGALRDDNESHTATLLDVEFLDHALFRLLETGLLSIFRDAPLWVNRYAKILSLPLIRFITIVATNGQTPATRILKLERTSAAAKDASSYSNRLILFGLLSAFFPALRDPLFKYLETKIQSRLDDNQFEASDLARLAQKRQRIVFTLIQKIVTRLFPLARLCCLLACWTGITKTPSLLMLALGLKFQHKGPHNARLHVDYAHRRWIQQEATSTAKVFLAGLWMISSWNPFIDALLSNPIARLVARIGPIQAVEPTTCPICNGEINVPLILSCGHTNCYACFYADLNRAKKTRCRICRKWNNESQAVLAYHR